MPNFCLFWSKGLVVMPRYTYIEAYLHTCILMKPNVQVKIIKHFFKIKTVSMDDVSAKSSKTRIL